MAVVVVVVVVVAALSLALALVVALAVALALTLGSWPHAICIHAGPDGGDFSEYVPTLCARLDSGMQKLELVPKV